MLEHVIVIFYNFAVFCGICSLSLAGLLLYKQRNRVLEKLFAFLIVFFIYGFLNMLLYYRLHVLVASSIMPYYATLITIAYTLMNCQWVDFIIEVLDVKRTLRKWLYVICAVCILLWIADSLIFVDSHLNVVNKAGNEITTVVEGIVVIIMAVFIIKVLRDKQLHFFCAIESAFILAFFACITSKDIRISFFQHNIQDDMVSTWSFCAVFCFLTNAATLIYLIGLFKKFIEDARRDKEEIHLLELTLEDLRDKYHVSQREMEVLILIYKGKNNGEIADELFISGNTVKKHINSIFKKLNVSSKAEIISKIRLKSF